MNIKLIAIAGIILLNTTLISYAVAPQGALIDGQAVKSSFIQGDPKVFKEVKQAVSQHTKYSNEFKIDKLQDMYTEDYMNADGFGKEKLFSLINETWKGYPDIKYSSQIKDIRVGDKYTVVLTSDKAVATTAKKSDVTNDYGELFSSSENLLYFKKVGKDWKIFAEKVVSEKTVLKYGSSKKISMEISAPKIVKPNEEYTISLRVNKAPNAVVVSSISAEPIVYPEIHSKEVFRQINEKGLLERIVKANSNNNNEMAIASLGFTETVFDIYQNSRLKVTGLALVMQRVNVSGEKSFVPDDLSRL